MIISISLPRPRRETIINIPVIDAQVNPPARAEGWDPKMYTRKLLASMLVIVLSTSAFVMVSWDAGADEGSADSWGYSWTDSNAPAPSILFDWVEISSTGTDVGLHSTDDSYVGPLPIGFSFEFYGNAYTEFYVSSNGYVSFGSGSSDYSNSPIPTAYDWTHNFVAPFWDDLTVDYWPYNAGVVYYETLGVSPNSQLVVEYYEVSRLGDYDLLTFEIILNETGEIWLQYLTMSGETGSSATIGIENSDGSFGSEYSYNEASVSNGLAVMFEEGLIGFGADQTGLADWGYWYGYTLSLRNGQAITDSFDITVDDSYLGWTVEIYDDSYILMTDSNLNGIPDTGDLAPGETIDMYVSIYVPDPPVEQNETTVMLASSFADPAMNDTVTLTTRADQAVFSPPHSDYGYDTDVDGDFDYLVVDVAVDSIAGGYLSVSANLLDAGGMESVTYSWETVMAPVGPSVVSAYFDGEDIYESMIDGPYLVEIGLYDNDGYSIGFDTYDTSAYSHTDFDEPAAMFVPPHSDYARDDDSNGMYDCLVVNVTVEVFEPGYYTIDAYLYDSGFWMISYLEHSGSLDVGVHEIQLLFPASEINESGLDDTCELYLNLYLDNFTWVASSYHTTGYYVYTDFEGAPVEFAPPHDDYAEDTDTDGYYNQIVITIYIECYEAGLFDLETWVYDPWGNDFMEVFETLSLDVGIAEYVITLDSETIRERGISGYYDVEMYLIENSTSIVHDSEWYETDGYYYYYDFDPVGAYFDSADDYGRDTDSDGLYNEVVATLYIDPVSSGYFEIEATVYDYYSNWMDFIEEVVYVEEGIIFEYEIIIDPYALLTSGGEGCFYLDVYLYDDTGSIYYDSGFFSTSYYYLDDFDPIGAFFESPHEDCGRDDDGDTLYDYLVFTLYLNASSAGYYDLGVDVWDDWGYFNYYWYELYLPADTITPVEIEIDSYSLWENGVSGYWYLDMYVYDHATSFEYDSDYHYADYYDLTDFDQAGVLFDPPHDDYAYDYDGDSYYDYLVVEVELDCTERGEYTVRAELYDSWAIHLATASVTQSMIVGNNMAEITFDGWVIEYNGVSDNFRVELTVEDDDGMILDSDTHYTDYYYWYDFAGPPAEFMPPYSDFAVDADADGLFDHLVVNASVEVSVAGDYIVFATLYDGFDVFTDAAIAEAYLEEGVQVVKLWFSGWSIAVANSDPWYIELELFDDERNAMDYDTYDIWGTYARADFDLTIPAIESGWAYEPVAVDGVVTAGEWFGAGAADLIAVDGVNEIAASMYVLNNGTHLFVLVDAVGDVTESDGDGAQIGFDTGNDETLSDGHEDRFALVTAGAGIDSIHYIFDSWFWDWTPHCFPFDNTNSDHEGLGGAVGFVSSPDSSTAHRVYEFCVPLALIMASPGDMIGFAGIPAAYDDEGGYSSWPAYYDVEDDPPLNTYGDLVLSEEPPLTTVELDGDEGEADWFVSDVEVIVTATGGTGGVNATYYRVDGSAWTEYSEPFTVTGDAVHTVEFYSDDVAGNDEPVRSVAVMIDSEAPETTASVEGTIGLNDWVVSEATVAFTSEDETSGVAVIMCRLDGGDWMEQSGDTYEISEDGAHTLEYYSIDVAGHEDSVKSIEFRVDLTAPVTTALLDGSTVTLTVFENASGVVATMYRIDAGEWIVYEGAFEVKGSGNHTVGFYSTDAAGHNETVNSIEVEGATGTTIFGMDLWTLLLIIVIMVAIAVPAVFGLRRRAKAGGSGPVIKDAMPPGAQLGDDASASWPEEQLPPPGDEPPPA